MIKKLVILALFCNSIALGMELAANKPSDVYGVLTEVSRIADIEPSVASHMIPKQYWYDDTKCDVKDLVNSVCFDPTGKYLVTGGKKLSIFDAASGALLVDQSNGASIYSVCFDPTGKYLAVGGAKGANILDVSGVLVKNICNDSVNSVCFDHVGKYLVAGGAGGLCIFDVVSGDTKKTPFENGLRSVCCALTGELAIGNEEGVIIFRADKVVHLVNAGRARSICFNPITEGVTMGSDGKFCIFDSKSGKQRVEETFDHTNVNSVCWDSTGKMLAIGCDHQKEFMYDGFVEIMDTVSHGAIRISYNKGIEEVCFDPTGKFLALGGRNGLRVLTRYEKWTSGQKLLLRKLCYWLFIEKPNKKINKLDLLLADVKNKFECPEGWIENVMQTFPEKMRFHIWNHIDYMIRKFGKDELELVKDVNIQT